MTRRGASLLELLVVVAILAVLLGLLLPAVQKVRGAADRMRYGSNLKQLDLAAHLHHDTDGRLPPGMTDYSHPLRYASWGVFLLPYLEQQPLWDATAAAYAADPSPRNPSHDRPRTAVVPAFGCPTDPRVQVPWRVRNPHTGLPHPTAVVSYLGVSGDRTGDRAGPLYLGSRTQLVHVRDGASNTLLLGERPPSFDLAFGWWYFGAGQDIEGSMDVVLAARERTVTSLPVYRLVCGPGPFAFGPGRTEDPCAAFHFWSDHPGGANFAFCDGSVRFLRYDAAAVLPALATRAGGEGAAIPD